MSIKYI